MVNKILLPQEIETFYIIPSLRKHFALFLKEKGMKQKDIADILMVNTAAISQYTTQKRGNQITFNEEILEEIKASSERVTDNLSYMRETQLILKKIRETKYLCDIHRQFSDVPEGCSPEIVGCTPVGVC